MRQLRTTVIALLASLPLNGAEPLSSSALPAKDPPADWKAADLNKVMPYSWDTGPTRVLAWEVFANGPCRCLCAKRLTKPTKEGEKYALAIVSGSPGDWSLNMAHFTGLGGSKLGVWRWSYQTYKSAPTDSDITRLLGEWQWDFILIRHNSQVRGPGVRGSLPARRLIDGGICPAAWKEILGRAPSENLFSELKRLKGKPD